MRGEPDAWQRREVPIGGTTPRDFLENPQRRLRRFIERWIVGRGDDIRSVLDVGCNAGIEAWRLGAAGFEGRYVGIDSNRKAVAIARRELSRPGAVSFLQGDARRLSFRDCEFDCVLAKDILEHLEHYRRPLAEIARLARRWIVIGLFLPLSWRERIERHADGYWLNRYARGPFLDRLAELGFVVERSKILWRLWAREEVLIARRRSSPARVTPAHRA